MVERLDFHVCADKTSIRQYLFWDMPRLQVFLCNKGPDNQLQKICDNSVKHNLLGFSLKNLKIAPLRPPSPPSSSISHTSMLWASNLSAAWVRCNLQTHQRKTIANCGVVSVRFVTGYSLFIYVSFFIFLQFVSKIYALFSFAPLFELTVFIGYLH